jgi:hypothetical protein
MQIEGGCHCGAVRYEVAGEVLNHVLCHCIDCRRHAGAPLVGWAMYPQEAVQVKKGAPKIYASSEHGRRHFCDNCGSGLFYVNAEVLPGVIDVQSATFDEPQAALPQAHIQTAEQIGWMRTAHLLPSFERYPPQP